MRSADNMKNRQGERKAMFKKLGKYKRRIFEIIEVANWRYELLILRWRKEITYIRIPLMIMYGHFLIRKWKVPVTRY